MSLVERKSGLIISVWVAATLLFAFFATGIGAPQTIFGLPWIFYLSIICQLSILFLFIFISKKVWKSEEEPR